MFSGQTMLCGSRNVSTEPRRTLPWIVASVITASLAIPAVAQVQPAYQPQPVYQPQPAYVTPGVPGQTHPASGMMAPVGWPQGMPLQAPAHLGAGFVAPQQAGIVSPAVGTQGPAMIQQVQNTAESARQLHHLIESMPTHQEDLELIERRSQLMITKANVVRYAIADPSVVDIIQFSPKELSLLGLARGTTTLHMWFEGHTEPVIYLVKTIRDPDLNQQRKLDYGRLEQNINKLFPNSKVYLIPMSWKILVRGQARNQEEAAHILAVIRGEVINQDGGLFGNGFGNGAFGAGGVGGVGGVGGGTSGVDFLYGNGNVGNLWSSFIINELRVPGEYQINLRVRIAELNRSQARNMGVDLNVLFNDSQLLFTNLGAAAGATLGGVFENGEIGVFLNWLASNGTAKILVEPQLVVLSGRPARLLAGGEFAVPTTVGIGGAAGQTTSFRGYGTSLLVTPTVDDRDLIRVNTVAEYSDLDTANAVGGIPGTQSRRIETTVEMREGQTFAIAGLLSHKTLTEVTRIPFLGDIPKIGPLLFSSKHSTQEENELLILITPEIVRPMDPHEVPPVPGFEVTHPMDQEFYKHNMTEGSPDMGYYQLPPYGSGAVGTNVGYQHFNPGPANSMYSPQPTNPNGTGFSSPTPMQGGIPSGPATAVPPATLPPVPQDQRRGNGYGPGAMRTPVAPMNGNAPSQTMQAGWTRPTGAPQTIVPSNYTGPSQPTGNTQRTARDQGRSNRY